VRGNQVGVAVQCTALRCACTVARQAFATACNAACPSPVLLRSPLIGGTNSRGDRWKAARDGQMQLRCRNGLVSPNSGK